LPQFEQVLTPEQRQAYVEEIEKNLANARRVVAVLQGRRLSRDQTTYLARIRAFIAQANEARKTDLFRARNLSERASVLADDLLRSVQ
jgi:UDP-N-acetylmuramate-alanine ligase